MTAPNHGGWTESDDTIAWRSQKSLALHWAAEIYNGISSENEDRIVLFLLMTLGPKHTPVSLAAMTFCWDCGTKHLRREVCPKCSRPISDPNERIIHDIAAKIGVQAVLANRNPQELADAPQYILTRSWVDRHLNSDDDLKHFKGGAVIR
jgi:ribosomal protein L32